MTATILPPRLREADNGGSWARGPLRLPLRFGEYKVGTVGFDGFINTGHFLRRTAQMPALSSEADQLLRHDAAQAVLLSSQPCPDPLSTFSVANGMIRYVATRFSHYYIDLSGTFDEYLASLTSSRRATLRRKVRNLRDAAGAGFAFEAISSPDDVPRFLEQAALVSSKTYQQRLLDAGLPAGVEFQEWISRLASENRVRGYLLRWGDRPISYLLCTARDRVLFYDWVGYDPDFAERSPGAVLQHLAIEHLYAERAFDIFDFTEGEGDHKRASATHSVNCADVWFFPLAPRSVAALTGHAATRNLSAALVRVLTAARVKGRVKRFLRRRA
jgi:CelD/BcsL family acetyltransferase involved in cellulose biosynthesis